MRRSSVVSALAALGLVGAVMPAVAAPVAPGAHRAPAPVTRVRAFDDRPAVRLTWVDPAGHDFDHVVVRYQRGSIAPKHHHGTYEGHRVRVGHHATTAKLPHLSRDTVYSVSIWAVGARGRRSVSRHARFTTDGGHTRGRYTARFTDASGHPLAGVVATAEPYTTGHRHTAVSGRNGRVAFRLPAGQYVVDASGSRATGGASDLSGYAGTERYVTVKARRTRSAGAIVLPAGGAVRVRVVDEKGRPVAGVRPELTPLAPYVQPVVRGEYSVPFAYFAGNTPLGTARTGADGEATLTGIAPGTAFQVCVNPYSYAGVTEPRFRSACTSSSALARPGGVVSSATLVVRRVGGDTIAGQVRSRGGRVRGGSYVSVERGRRAVASVPTQPDGRFRVGGIAPGTYRVCASGGTLSGAGRTGYRAGCAAHQVTVRDGAGATSVSVVRQVAAAVTGTITGPHGIPVPGAYVEVGRFGGQGYGTTDSLGHFLVKGISGGTHSLCATTFGDEGVKALPFGVRSDCGKHRIRFAARPGRTLTGLDAQLRSGAAISGTVVDRRGRAVPYAEVTIGPRPDKVGSVTAESLADAHGRFAFDGLRSAHYRLCATSIPGPAGSGGIDELENYDFVPATACHHSAITLRTGHRRRAVRLVLPTTAAVRVTAVDERGHGVAGVDAAVVAPCHKFCDRGTSLLARNSTVAASGLTGAHGSVLLDGLRPGKYAVCLFAYYGTVRTGAPSAGYSDRCTGSTFTVVVRAGHTVAKRVVLHPAGAVSGQLTDAAGHPLQGVVVHVQGSAANDLPQDDLEFESSFAAADGGASAPPGYFSTTDADGDYTVRSVHPGDRLVCADPTGAAGSSTGGYLSQCVGGAVGSTKKGVPVAVHTGVTTTGVDLALTEGGTVTGHVTSSVSRGATGVVLFRGQHYVAQRHPSSSFDFRFRGVAPGTYSVCVAAYGRKTATGRCYRDAAWDPDAGTGPAPDASPVQVAAGGVTSGIDVVVPT